MWIFFVSRFPDQLKKYTLLFAYLCSITFLAVLTWYGFRISFRVMAQTSPALQLPMFYPYVAVPIGAFLMMINFIYLMIEQIENYRSGDPEELEVAAGVEEGVQKAELNDLEEE